MRRIILAAAGVMLLQGCMPTYVAPSGTKTARVNIAQSGSLALCTDDRLFNLSAQPDNYVEVPAGQRISLQRSFTSQGYNVSHSCSTGISFVPEEGQSYYANFELREERCILLVFREVPESRVGLGIEHSLGKRQYCKN
ncbi:hypothetical protein [Solimonas sp. SE-A11]|uniref:hypothetical protein n=1 Tax=Solimonas sp. SE-A11 TaxID=3054954 RepID=UPI00259C6D18|nr:hypothetical protein [Solimonas sp. SE-A11]MDM4769231.1 hypothetical protein [Solimonas sp. SE-A11]